VKVATALVILLAGAAAASAAIVPQRGIAGVRLAMTRAQVRAVLGAPAAAFHGRNEFGTFTVYRYRGLRVTFQGNRTATAILTTRTTERTAAGVGVGSTEGQVGRRWPVFAAAPRPASGTASSGGSSPGSVSRTSASNAVA
jgi:hypothetical protein